MSWVVDGTGKRLANESAAEQEVCIKCGRVAMASRREWKVLDETKVIRILVFKFVDLQNTNMQIPRLGPLTPI